MAELLIAITFCIMTSNYVIFREDWQLANSISSLSNDFGMNGLITVKVWVELSDGPKIKMKYTLGPSINYFQNA